MRKWSGSCLKCLKLGTTEDREISAFNSSLKRSMFQRRWVPPHLHKHIQIITLAPAKVRSNLKVLDALFSKELSQFTAFRMQLIVIRQLRGGSCQCASPWATTPRTHSRDLRWEQQGWDSKPSSCLSSSPRTVRMWCLLRQDQVLILTTYSAPQAVETRASRH